MENFEKLTVKEIDKRIKEMPLQKSKDYISILINDSRKSVKKLALTLKKKYDRFLKEKTKVAQLRYYENNLKEKGYKLIAGIDEAGRGPLAGPVVAAAVILPHSIYIDGIDDSKKLSSQKRENLFQIIREKALSIGVGIIDNVKIDQVNILCATKMAMAEAIKKLSLGPEYLLIDALKLPDINIKQMSIIKGDSKSISIAAASIIAKVTRDKIMDQYNEVYPEYGFEHHKGYPTKQHYFNIQRYGLTAIHRKSFFKKDR